VIVIDTSALVAIYRREPVGALFYSKIARAEESLLPPPCAVEFVLLRRYGGDRNTWLSRFVQVQEIRIPDFTAEMASIATGAADRYGRGTGHPARLNFGDCLSYAVAKHLDVPLLYKGDDFDHTDIESALPK